jgi:hypothetical protein
VAELSENRALLDVVEVIQNYRRRCFQASLGWPIACHNGDDVALGIDQRAIETKGRDTASDSPQSGRRSDSCDSWGLRTSSTSFPCSMRRALACESIPHPLVLQSAVAFSDGALCARLSNRASKVNDHHSGKIWSATPRPSKTLSRLSNLHGRIGIERVSNGLPASIGLLGIDRQILSLNRHGLLGLRAGHGHGVGALRIGHVTTLGRHRLRGL